MNKLTLKQISILSVMLGVVLGILTLIPFVGQVTFVIVMCFASVVIIWFMQKVELLSISTTKESIIIGGIIGFVSFLAFCAIYLPAVWILGKLLNLYSVYGVSLFLGVGSLGIILLLVLFMGILSATLNSFTGFLTYYVIEFLRGIDKKGQ